MGKICLMFIVFLVSCQNQPQYSTKLNRIEKHTSIGTSLIEHPYIFEEQQLRLDSLYVQNFNGQYKLKALISGDVSRFKKRSFLFVHGYFNVSDSVFKNLDMALKPSSAMNNLRFEKTLKQENYQFHHMEIGLASHSSNKQTITLSLNDITINAEE